MKQILSVLVVLITLISCASKDDNYTEIDTPLLFEVPSNFPEVTYDLELNPPTEKGFELGKKLFYDGRLSSDGVVSCGFCHEQKTAFTHHGHQFSHGVADRVGTRNTPAIQNVAFMNEFTWDGATAHLDLFSIIPINNPLEMDETLPSILSKLKEDKDYVKLFSLAFEDGEINNENFLKALSQFMLMMISSTSKYDKYIRKEPGGTFTSIEEEGLQIFKSKCAACHATDLFSDGTFRNNGLAINSELNDEGRFVVTVDENDKYKFKVPSLRNVAITAPYMHDGRFGSLESVLNFYAENIEDSPTLDPILKKGNTLGIELSSDDKKALRAFLNTLTDEAYITDKRFSEF